MGGVPCCGDPRRDGVGIVPELEAADPAIVDPAQQQPVLNDGTESTSASEPALDQAAALAPTADDGAGRDITSAMDPAPKQPEAGLSSRSQQAEQDDHIERHESEQIVDSSSPRTPTIQVDYPRNPVDYECIVCRKAAESRCRLCCKVWYCSIECQEKDWVLFHHRECSQPLGGRKKQAKKGCGCG